MELSFSDFNLLARNLQEEWFGSKIPDGQMAELTGQFLALTRRIIELRGPFYVPSMGTFQVVLPFDDARRLIQGEWNLKPLEYIYSMFCDGSNDLRLYVTFTDVEFAALLTS